MSGTFNKSAKLYSHCNYCRSCIWYYLWSYHTIASLAKYEQDDLLPSSLQFYPSRADALTIVCDELFLRLQQLSSMMLRYRYSISIPQSSHQTRLPSHSGRASLQAMQSLPRKLQECTYVAPLKKLVCTSCHCAWEGHQRFWGASFWQQSTQSSQRNMSCSTSFTRSTYDMMLLQVLSGTKAWYSAL